MNWPFVLSALLAPTPLLSLIGWLVGQLIGSGAQPITRRQLFRCEPEQLIQRHTSASSLEEIAEP